MGNAPTSAVSVGIQCFAGPCSTWGSGLLWQRQNCSLLEGIRTCSTCPSECVSVVCGRSLVVGLGMDRHVMQVEG